MTHQHERGWREEGMMSAGDATTLPPILQSALEAEIDPDEELRWCGRPDGGRVVRRYISATIFFSILLILFGSMALAAAWTARADLIGLGSSFVQRGNGVPTWGAVWAMGLIGAGLVSAGVIGGPSCLIAVYRAATRTVYAVTDTRVFSIVLSRKGLPRLTSVEPGHPLSIARTDFKTGRGDIHLYPNRSQQHGAAMSLLGIERPREVERLIRSTFDPPGAPKKSWR